MVNESSTFSKIVLNEDELNKLYIDKYDIVPHNLHRTTILDRRPSSKIISDMGGIHMYPYYVISIISDVDYKIGDINLEIDGYKLKVSGECIETLGDGTSSHIFQRKYYIPRYIDLTSMTKFRTQCGTYYIIFCLKICKELTRMKEGITEYDESPNHEESA